MSNIKHPSYEVFLQNAVTSDNRSSVDHISELLNHSVLPFFEKKVTQIHKREKFYFPG